MSDAVTVDAGTSTEAAASPPPAPPEAVAEPVTPEIPVETPSPASNPQPAETPVITEPPIEAPEPVEAPATPEPQKVPAEAPQASQPPAASSAPEPTPAPAQVTIKDRLHAAMEKIRFNKRKKLDKIVELARHKGRIKNDDVQIAVRVSHATATRYLSQLVVAGRLRVIAPLEHAEYEPV